MNWNLLEFRQNFPNSKVKPSMPSRFEEMKSIAGKLSDGYSFLRVDLYEINGKVFFSEFTFFSDNGTERFHPEEWDYELGQKIMIQGNGN